VKVVTTSISIDENVLKEADKIVEDRRIPLVKNRSNLIEYALRRVIEELDKEEKKGV